MTVASFFFSLIGFQCQKERADNNELSKQEVVTTEATTATKG
jgi:hypothetical protein